MFAQKKSDPSNSKKIGSRFALPMCATPTCLPPHNQSLPPSCPPHFLNPGAATVWQRSLKNNYSMYKNIPELGLQKLTCSHVISASEMALYLGWPVPDTCANEIPNSLIHIKHSYERYIPIKESTLAQYSQSSTWIYRQWQVNIVYMSISSVSKKNCAFMWREKKNSTSYIISHRDTITVPFISPPPKKKKYKWVFNINNFEIVN